MMHRTWLRPMGTRPALACALCVSWLCTGAASGAASGRPWIRVSIEGVPEFSALEVRGLALEHRVGGTAQAPAWGSPVSRTDVVIVRRAKPPGPLWQWRVQAAALGNQHTSFAAWYPKYISRMKAAGREKELLSDKKRMAAWIRFQRPWLDACSKLLRKSWVELVRPDGSIQRNVFLYNAFPYKWVWRVMTDERGTRQAVEEIHLMAQSVVADAWSRPPGKWNTPASGPRGSAASGALDARASSEVLTVGRGQGARVGAVAVAQMANRLQILMGKAPACGDRVTLVQVTHESEIEDPGRNRNPSALRPLKLIELRIVRSHVPMASGQTWIRKVYGWALPGYGPVRKTTAQISLRGPKGSTLLQLLLPDAAPHRFVWPDFNLNTTDPGTSEVWFVATKVLPWGKVEPVARTEGRIEQARPAAVSNDLREMQKAFGQMDAELRRRRPKAKPARPQDPIVPRRELAPQ